MSGRAGTKAPRARKGARRWWPASPVAQRWIFVAGFTFALLVGLPVAHALLGDAGAVLLGTFAFGFVVGRMTMRR